MPENEEKESSNKPGNESDKQPFNPYDASLPMNERRPQPNLQEPKSGDDSVLTDIILQHAPEIRRELQGLSTTERFIAKRLMAKFVPDEKRAVVDDYLWGDGKKGNDIYPDSGDFNDGDDRQYDGQYDEDYDHKGYERDYDPDGELWEEAADYAATLRKTGMYYATISDKVWKRYQIDFPPVNIPRIIEEREINSSRQKRKDDAYNILIAENYRYKRMINYFRISGVIAISVIIGYLIRML